MAVLHLFDNSSPTWTSVDEAGVRTAGMRFVSPFTGQITALLWRRFDGTAGHAPSAITLWDWDSQQRLFTTTSVNDSLSAGWKTVTLPAPVLTAAGRNYAVTCDWPANSHRTQTAAATTAPPTFPLYSTNNGGTYKNSAGAGFPDTLSTDGVWQGADIAWEQVGTDVPATPADVANGLASWLISTGDNTHQTDGLPWQTKVLASGIDTNVSAVKAETDDWAFGLGAAAHGYYADIKTLIGNIKSITDTLPTPIAQLTSIVLDHYTADIAGILAQIDDVLSNLGAQSTDLSGTAGSAVGALSGRTGFPATGWSMSAEEDFEDAIAFAEPADAYVLSITSYQDTQPANASPAGLWLPRLGWWCVLNGSLASQRQFVDFEQMLLDDQGRRMPGCAIQLRPGTLATVQAWLLA